MLLFGRDCYKTVNQLSSNKKKIARVLKLQMRLQRNIMSRSVCVLPDMLGVLTLLLQLLL